MVPCIAIGDGVALGIAQARPECVAAAVVGISSAAFVASDLNRLRPADTAIISLGTSDPPGAEIADSLRRVREAVTANRVIWLNPNATPATRLAVATVAAEWHDSIIDTRPAAAPDAIAGVGQNEVPRFVLDHMLSAPIVLIAVKFDDHLEPLAAVSGRNCRVMLGTLMLETISGSRRSPQKPPEGQLIEIWSLNDPRHVGRFPVQQRHRKIS
jgi:hypothetical protein